eukprot:1077996-Prorocentrum_minimum.AAC.1
MFQPTTGCSPLPALPFGLGTRSRISTMWLGSCSLSGTPGTTPACTTVTLCSRSVMEYGSDRRVGSLHTFALTYKVMLTVVYVQGGAGFGQRVTPQREAFLRHPREKDERRGTQASYAVLTSTSTLAIRASSTTFHVPFESRSETMEFFQFGAASVHVPHHHYPPSLVSKVSLRGHYV